MSKLTEVQKGEGDTDRDDISTITENILSKNDCSNSIENNITDVNLDSFTEGEEDEITTNSSSILNKVLYGNIRTTRND